MCYFKLICSSIFKIVKFKLSKFQSFKLNDFKIYIFQTKHKKREPQHFTIQTFRVSKLIIVFYNKHTHLFFFIIFYICSKYTARPPFWSTTNCKVATKSNFIWKIRGNPLPESCVGLFITLCTGWILKKRTVKLVLFANILKKNGGETYISPPNSRSTAP